MLLPPAWHTVPNTQPQLGALAGWRSVVLCSCWTSSITCSGVGSHLPWQNFPFPSTSYNPVVLVQTLVSCILCIFQQPEARKPLLNLCWWSRLIVHKCFASLLLITIFCCSFSVYCTKHHILDFPGVNTSLHLSTWVLKLFPIYREIKDKKLCTPCKGDEERNASEASTKDSYKSSACEV